MSRVTLILCGNDLNNLLTGSKGLRSARIAETEKLAESVVPEGAIAPSSTREPVHRLRSKPRYLQGRTEADACNNLYPMQRRNVYKEKIHEKNMNE